MKMTIQTAAKDALDCQDACNLAGVLNSLNRIIQEVIMPEADRLSYGTDWINQHPIITVFLDKLASLNGSQVIGGKDRAKIREAYNEVRTLAAAA